MHENGVMFFFLFSIVKFGSFVWSLVHGEVESEKVGKTARLYKNDTKIFERKRERKKHIHGWLYQVFFWKFSYGVYSVLCVSIVLWSIPFNIVGYALKI